VTLSLISVEYGGSISPELVDLFQHILDKNPETRITMNELRVSELYNEIKQGQSQ
jgi:serine/threonine protein kinase